MNNNFKFNLKENEPFKFDYDTNELYCVLCEDVYNVYNDPFTVVIDTVSFIEITYELCLKCIYSFKNCMECKRELQEPWEKVYFNIKNKTYFCSCCYNDKRNKLYKKCTISYCEYCCNNERLKCKKV
jgi:hypothetical protein